MSRRLALVAILVGVACLRCRLLDVPLERDEGEYAYMGQLIRAGETPYLAAHNMKLPGTYYAYAGILGAFGETDRGIRLGLLVLNALTIVCLYALARTLADEATALVAAAAYGILSIGPPVLGFTANAEHFVVLPAVAGALVLARLVAGTPDAAASERRLGAAPERSPAMAPERPLALVASGLLLGTAFVMKQPGGAFVAFGLWVVALHRRLDPRAAWRVAVFAAAAALPFALTCAAMWARGAFEPFWFWTVTYAREYVSQIPLAVGLAHLADVGGAILRSAPLLWLLAAVGTTALAWDPAGRRAARVLVPFAFCSALAVCPGLRFSEHYFILLLPAASLLAGLGVSAVGRLGERLAPPVGRRLGAGLAIVAIVTAVAAEHSVLLDLPADGVARAVYGVNPFPEAREIARWIAAHSSPSDRIAVVGSEPEIYFYARRRAATSYIYTYPLMEPHPFAQRMQDDMVEQLTRAAPPLLVMVNVDTSWTRRPDSSRTIFAWTERTIATDYSPVGLVEIRRDAPATYRWDDDARAATPRTQAYVAVFARR